MRRLPGDADRWVGRLGRLGFLARGLLYAVVGGTTLRVAVGAGGSTTGSQGALRRIAQGPFGTGLLVATGLGLAGYAVWRLVQTFTTSRDRDRPFVGAIEQLSYPARALIYGALSWSAIRIATGSGGGTSGSGVTATLLQTAWGRLLVALIGAGVVAVGVGLWSFAVTGRFRDELRIDDEVVRRWLVPLGAVGHAGRGSAYLLTGGFVIHGAATADPQQARGLDGALAELAGTPAGPWLLGVVALGLLTFAAFTVAEARYHHVDVD